MIAIITLKKTDPDFVNLINMVRGSVGTNGRGSKVIWSRKNDYKLGLFVSANHVYGINTWTSLEVSVLALPMALGELVLAIWFIHFKYKNQPINK